MQSPFIFSNVLIKQSKERSELAIAIGLATSCSSSTQERTIPKKSTADVSRDLSESGSFLNIAEAIDDRFEDLSYNEIEELLSSVGDRIGLPTLNNSDSESPSDDQCVLDIIYREDFDYLNSGVLQYKLLDTDMTKCFEGQFESFIVSMALSVSCKNERQSLDHFDGKPLQELDVNPIRCSDGGVLTETLGEFEVNSNGNVINTTNQTYKGSDSLNGQYLVIADVKTGRTTIKDIRIIVVDKFSD